MPSDQSPQAILTEPFQHDCERHSFENEVADVVALVWDNREAGYEVPVAPNRGKIWQCVEIRALPWIYTKGGKPVRALVIYLNISNFDPMFLHLVVDDEIHNFSTPDPEKWARWLELLAEIAREVLHRVV